MRTLVKLLLPVLLFAITLTVPIVYVPVSVHASSIGPDTITFTTPTITASSGYATQFSQGVNIVYTTAAPGQAGTTCPPPPSTARCSPKLVSMQYVVQFDSSVIEIDNSVCVTSPIDANTYCGVTPEVGATRFAVQELPANNPCGVNFCANEAVVAGSMKQIFVASISALAPTGGSAVTGGLHSTIHWFVKSTSVSVVTGADGTLYWGPSAGSASNTIPIHFSPPDTFYSTSSTSAIDPSMASVFYTPTDGSFAISGGIWGAFTQIGGTSAMRPALCQSAPGTVELVVTGQDGQIYHNTYPTTLNTNPSFGGTWFGFDSAGGHSIDAPSCAVLGTNLYAAVRGSSSQIYYNVFSLSTRAWGAWASISGLTKAQPIIVASQAANRLDLLVVGLNNQLYHMAFPGGTPTGVWDVSPNGLVQNVPAIASDSTGLNVVVQGFPNVPSGFAPVWYNKYLFSSASWQGWTFLNGYTTTSPAMTIDSAGTVYVLVRGLDGQTYSIAKPSTGAFGAWTSLGGVTSSRPTVAAVGTSLAALVNGTDGIIKSNTFNGSTWAGWTSTTAIGSTDAVVSAS